MNLTLRDLVRWPDSPLRTRADSARSTPDAALRFPDRDVSWPVSMRSTVPMLPHVDEGALVLVPAATLAEVGARLPSSGRELRRRGVAALIVERETCLDLDDLDLLWSAERVGPELEARLTRLLSGRRARLYTRGTELDRALTEATLQGHGPARLLALGAARSGRDLVLLDGRGEVYEVAPGTATGDAPVPPPPTHATDVTPNAPLLMTDTARAVEWLFCPLPAQEGWVALRGPRGTLDECDRLTGQRVAAACALVHHHAAAPPRLGPARRAPLVADLLRPDLPPAERLSRAETLGLDPSASYLVCFLQAGSEAGRLGRALAARLAPAVAVEPVSLDAPALGGFLLHAPGQAELLRALPGLRETIAREPARASAAGSAVAPSLDAVPEAARQARFALELLQRGLLPGPMADWHNVGDLGPYQVLYRLWGTPDAARFVAAVLGDLPAYDARYGGELLPTLAAYLAHGGAARLAAERLAIHRNTLTYRLRRVAQLTGHSPFDPAHQFTLHLAVLLHQLPPAP